MLNEITDVSFRDMKIALNNDLNNFDKSKCQNIGDLIIAFDYLNFFENKKDSALCTTDHHFDTICKKLEINKVNPLTEEIFIYPT